MQDVVYVAIVIAFFALMALFVPACERIIGSDEEALALGEDLDEEAADLDAEAVAA